MRSQVHRLASWYGLAGFALLIVTCAVPDVVSCPNAPKLTIAGKTEAGPYELIRLELQNTPPEYSVVWRISPPGKEDRATTSEDRLEFVAPAGEYYVEAIVAYLCNGKPKLEYAAVRVKIHASPLPPPGPQPPQPQPPQPQPPQPQPPQPQPPQPPPGPNHKIDPFNALGRITFGQAGCTATIIKTPDFPRADGKVWILTAAHCVSRVGQTGRYVSRDGKVTLTVVVAAMEPRSDCAWLITTEPVKADLLHMATIARTLPERGTSIWHAGFGFDKPGNIEEGQVTQPEDSRRQTAMVLSVSSGDSGGGIFRKDTNELISCVCCTRQIGAKVDMYGASVTAIWDLFQKAAPPRDVDYRGAMEAQEWKPLPIPFPCQPGVREVPSF